MYDEIDKDEAEHTLALMRNGRYNLDRPSSIIIPELIKVILMLSDK